MKNIYYLLRQEFYDQKKRIIVLAAVIFLIFLCSRFLQEFVHRFGGYIDYDYQEGIGGYLFAAGFIFTSICFSRSMHSKRGQHAWLMLPVHAHEKLIAKIISYSLLYPLGLIVFTFISSLVNEGIMRIIWHHSVPLFNLFDPMIWEMTGHYIVMSSLFLMGAAYFRSAHLIKTVLAVLAFSVSLTIILGLVTRIAYAPFFHDFMFSDTSKASSGLYFGNIHVDENLLFSQFNCDRWTKIGSVIVKSVYWGLLAPLFWTVTYFRIREIEAKDAV